MKFLLSVVLLLLLVRCTAVPLLHVVTFSHNDVQALLEESAGTQPFALRTYASVDAALSAARAGDSLLVLGDGTLGAACAVNFTQAHWKTLLSLNLSGFYVELASTLPQDPANYEPSKAYYYDRVTARTDALAPHGVQPLDIIMAQGAFFQNYPVQPNVNSSSLVYAHVAGSSTAVYGLPPPAALNPVLFAPFPDTPSGLLGSIALSCIVSCRYTPLPKWRGVWNYILTGVLGVPYNAFPTWTPLVAPFGANPAPALAAAAAAWPPPPSSSSSTVFPAALFHAVAPNATAAALRATDFLYSGSGLLLWGDEALCPTPYAPPSASYACMLEGFGSELSPSGDQPLADDARMDCSAEGAMVLALRAGVEAAAASSGGSSGSGKQQLGQSQGQGSPPGAVGAAEGFAVAAGALLNFTWLYSAAAQGHNDPAQPDFGIVAWGVSSDAWSICSYGDDNARVILGSMVASAALGALPPPLGPQFPTSAWDEMIAKSILGNLRLASVHGFRPGRIDFPDFKAGGWQRFHYSGYDYLNVSSPQPHYQAQMWAAFLLAYARTCATGGCFQPLYSAALAGLESTMAAYEAAFGVGGGAGAAGGTFTRGNGGGGGPLPPCQWSTIQNNTYLSGCAASSISATHWGPPQSSPQHTASHHRRHRHLHGPNPSGKKSSPPSCFPNFPTPALAQAACSAEASCAGITSQGGGSGPWELRSSATPAGSSAGEASYLITNLPACHSPSPPRWEWTEYGSEEQARLLLPLAWLLRAEALGAPPGTPPNATHALWLTRVAGDYLATQSECGGVHETLGPPGQCDACPPATNAAYGTGEAPLIARGGEAITDQLYGNNFALVGLVEAGGAFVGPALRLGAYLSAIQVAATGGTVGKLSGAWMRGFDTGLWDFDGAAGDWGWGPWSIETGWSVTWTSAGLFTLAGNTTLFDVVLAQGGEGAGAGGFSAALVKQLCPLFFTGTEVVCP